NTLSSVSKKSGAKQMGGPRGNSSPWRRCHTRHQSHGNVCVCRFPSASGAHIHIELYLSSVAEGSSALRMRKHECSEWCHPLPGRREADLRRSVKVFCCIAARRT